MKKVALAIGIFLIVALTFVGCRTTTTISLPQTYPAKYAPWPSEKDSIADVVIFNKAFDVKQYGKLIIVPADFSNAIIEYDEDKDEKKQKPGTSWTDTPDKDKVSQIKTFASLFDKTWYEKIIDKNKGIALPIEKNTDASSGLLLKTTIAISDPGSQSKRYLIGFGAGATRLKVKVSIVDSKTQETLVEFVQESREIGGAFGGDSINLLTDSTESIVEDNLSPLLKALFK